MKKNKNKLGLEHVLESIKSGLSPAQISKKHSVPKQTISDRVVKLRKLGCVEKEGYGVWKFVKGLEEVRKEGRGSKEGDSDFSQKTIRSHAFIWKIEFIKPYDWAQAIKKYRGKKLSFNLICKGKIPRTILDLRKIWLTKRGMTIYEPLDYMGASSFVGKGQAVYEMDRLIKKLIKIMGLKFRNYRFTTSREHYAQVKNALAKQFNDRKEKMIIRNENGTAWLWIDNSKGLHELETGDPNTSRQVQNYWNDLKKKGFKTNATYIEENFKESAKQIQKNAENLNYHAENMRSHVQAVKDLGAGVRELVSLIKELKGVKK